MTTIAITQTEIAADGLRIFGDMISGRDLSKIVETDEAVYAFTGKVPAMAPMIKWHKDGADPANLPPGIGDDWGTLVVINREHGVHKYNSECPYIEHYSPPIAFGAGADYAQGAMWHGASAREAIQHVCDNTDHTGGKIMVVDIRRFLEPMKQAAE